MTNRPFAGPGSWQSGPESTWISPALKPTLESTSTPAGSSASKIRVTPAGSSASKIRVTPAGSSASKIRSLVKDAIATAAHLTGALAALRRTRGLGAVSVRIFGYHRVVATTEALEESMPSLGVLTSTFMAHVEHLRAHYEILPLSKACDVILGARPAPERDVAVITFDDGYRDVLDNALPILAKHGLSATLFVSTRFTGDSVPHLHDQAYLLCRSAEKARIPLCMAASPAPALATWPLLRAERALVSGDAFGASEILLRSLPRAVLEEVLYRLSMTIGAPRAPTCLTWDDLRQAKALGMEIGSHTVNHVHLPLESEDDVRRELTESRDEIATQLRHTPDTFAYPAGRYSPAVIQAVRQAGYKAALTTEDRYNSVGTDLLRLGRKVLSEAHSRGASGQFRLPLALAQLDGLFSVLGMAKAEAGDHSPGIEEPWRP